MSQFYKCLDCSKKFSDVSFDPYQKRTTDFYISCIHCGSHNVKKLKNIFDE